MKYKNLKYLFRILNYIEKKYIIDFIIYLKKK